MTLLIKNSGYAFLIRLDLMFFISLWKKFQLLQILNDLSIRHLIKLNLNENDVKLLKFKESPVQVDFWCFCSVNFWILIPEMNISRNAMGWLICFVIVNLLIACPLSKKFNKFNESGWLPKAARNIQHNLNEI